MTIKLMAVARVSIEMLPCKHFMKIKKAEMISHLCLVLYLYI